MMVVERRGRVRDAEAPSVDASPRRSLGGRTGWSGAADRADFTFARRSCPPPRPREARSVLELKAWFSTSAIDAWQATEPKRESPE